MEEQINIKMERFNVLLEKAQYGKKQHQYDGIAWCIRNELQGQDQVKDQTKIIKGGIIADEMGLGKTLMMIGVMFVNFKRKTLIVVPPVLLEQWAAEIYKCSGHKALVYHGKTKEITDKALAEAPIVLTTYSMLLPSNAKDKTNAKANAKDNIGNTRLHKIRWNRLIFDEAHHLRNNNTTRYKSCTALRASIKWLVTGTPVQNKRSDFSNLCNVVGITSLEKDIMQKYILRRTKSEAGIILPPVFNHCNTIDWSNINEKMLAEEIHSLLPKQTFVKTRNTNPGFLAAKLEDKGALIAILRARQSCIMPALLKPITRGIKEDSYRQGTNSSSKLDAVIKSILEKKDNGNGKIIFCNFKKEIDFVAEQLRRGGMQKVVTYDGRNKKSIQTLSEEADAIVIQIQTGCEGLNLQKNFSEIYFISPHWNPSVEDQAVARCYRIGQVKPTNVYKFEMNGFDQQDPTSDPTSDPTVNQMPITLEKYVNKVQQTKRQIASEINLN